MASAYDLKPRFRALPRPLLDALARRGATANRVAVAALPFAARALRETNAA